MTDTTLSESTHSPLESGGGEIRINIPVYASKEEVQIAMEAMQVIAERWKEAE